MGWGWVGGSAVWCAVQGQWLHQGEGAPVRRVGATMPKPGQHAMRRLGSALPPLGRQCCRRAAGPGRQLCSHPAAMCSGSPVCTPAIAAPPRAARSTSSGKASTPMPRLSTSNQRRQRRQRRPAAGLIRGRPSAPACGSSRSEEPLEWLTLACFRFVSRRWFSPARPPAASPLLAALYCCPPAVA